ncbi:MAG TPA: hypothetical protein VGJ26_21175 [Pirellulales bacterium]|jgi:hypothetical protein
MTRRQFAFWLSFGFFTLAEKLRAESLEELATATIRFTEPDVARAASTSTVAESAAATHWRVTENNTWRWFERESWAAGRWKVSGVTTPINKRTGEPYEGKEGYLEESLVPDEVRFSRIKGAADEPREDALHRPDPSRRSRHGRPPSKWLRNLRANELSIWLRTIEVPEAGVSGMTFWEHLTRDHSFDPSRIAGLTNDEQAKLHAAAHYGY